MMNENLPDVCFNLLPGTEECIAIKLGERGYYPQPHFNPCTKDKLITLNKQINVTPAQASAMLAGSLLGWSVPAASPELYDENGKLKAGKTDGM